jgi:hypothetical protein
MPIGVIAIYLLLMSLKEHKNIFKTSRRMVATTPVFFGTLIGIFLIIAGTWILGLEQHSTVFHNAIMATLTLSGLFFFFLTTGLYKGVKLQDDLGKITDKIKFKRFPDWPEFACEFPVLEGEGILGFILGIIAAIALAALLAVLLWFLSFTLWALLLCLVAVIYWIFFRALRFVFRHAAICSGSLWASIKYGLGYTALYSCSIYGIIFALHYLVH